MPNNSSESHLPTQFHRAKAACEARVLPWATARIVVRRHPRHLPRKKVPARREANLNQKGAKNHLQKRQKLEQEEEVQPRQGRCAKERSKPKENSCQTKVIRVNEGQNCSQSQLRFKSTKIYKGGTILDLHSSQVLQETIISRLRHRTRIIARESRLFCGIGKKAQRRRDCPSEQRLPRRLSGTQRTHLAAVHRGDQERPRSGL